jgi:putative transposase
MTLLAELHRQVGMSQACRTLALPRSWYYRQQVKKLANHVLLPLPPRPAPKHALSEMEKAAVRTTLNSERFMEQSPREVYATLLDEGTYLCHWRTMYRILAEHDEVRERRNQRRHPLYKKPELLATAPKQVWSWDITLLKGPERLLYYYLYVILDIFSRYVVGWMVAEQESADLARQFIQLTHRKQNISADPLTLHSDRGAPMRAKPVTQLLADLGVNRSYARPYTSNDNPYSEAQFKTMKYRPDYPEHFDTLEHARQWASLFFHWYNHDHHHVGLGLMTPAVVHYGQAEAVQAQRQQVLATAYARRPERFGNRPPVAPSAPRAVWINPPQDTAFSAIPSRELQPGAQPRSRVGATALEASEHLAIIEGTLWPFWEEKSSLVVAGELSHCP